MDDNINDPFYSAKLVQERKANNLYDNSVIVIFGDHSSSLLERDVRSITNKN